MGLAPGHTSLHRPLSILLIAHVLMPDPDCVLSHSSSSSLSFCPFPPGPNETLVTFAPVWGCPTPSHTLEPCSKNSVLIKKRGNNACWDHFSPKGVKRIESQDREAGEIQQGPFIWGACVGAQRNWFRCLGLFYYNLPL